MIRRIISAVVLIPLVLLSLHYLPSPLFLMLVSVLLLLALLELFRLFSSYDVAGFWLTFPLTLFLPWLWTYRPALVPTYLLLGTLATLVWSVIRVREMKKGLPWASGNLLALFYLGPPFSIAAVLQSDRRGELFLVILVVWVTDTAAFLVGRTWGRHKITQLISPQKSLEGYLAGLVLCIIATILIGRSFFLNWSIPYLLLSGVILGTAAVGGDLFESVLKRGADLKDSSNLIPGHGGLLDRIDSLLFSLPAYYVLSTLVR